MWKQHYQTYLHLLLNKEKRKLQKKIIVHSTSLCHWERLFQNSWSHLYLGDFSLSTLAGPKRLYVSLCKLLSGWHMEGKLHFSFIILLWSFSGRNLALFTPAFKNRHSNSPNGNKTDGITNVHLSRGVRQGAKAEEMMIILQQLPYFNM